MSLVYLLTALPRLSLGEEPPLSLAEFAARARADLRGHHREDLEQVLLLNEIDHTVLVRNRAMLGLPVDEDDTPLEEYQMARLLRAEQQGHLLPPWVLKSRPMHLLLRYWFQKAYRHAHCHYLKNYIRVWLNTEEKLAGLLCKLEDMPQAAFEKHMEGGFDSIWRVMMQRYSEPDLGIGNRLRHFDDVKAMLQDADLARMESRLDEVRATQIDRFLGSDPFGVDHLLAYALRLRLVHRVAARDVTRGAAVLDQILQYEGAQNL